MPNPRQVALVVETSRAFGRGLIRGVAQYSREHGPWAITFTPRGLDDSPPDWLRGWKGDGVLARIENQRMADAILQLGVPVVELRGMLPDLRLPHIGVDNRAVVQLAVAHLAERGLRRFGFFGYRRGGYARMDERHDFFVEVMTERGLPYNIFDDWPRRQRHTEWDEEQGRLARWIQALAKPVGIVACSDDCGLQVLDACRRVGVAVPDQAAVIGIDNDEYLCMLSVPPLTSVYILPQRIGYEAAGLLAGMMDGQRPTALRIRTAVGPVVVRGSTDLLATEDHEAAAAITFVRAHACQRLRVADVARQVGLSPAALQARVRRALGRTVHQELQRVQVEQVKELLSDSDLSMKQIARRCGFRYTQYMSRVFREATGQTLAEYRKQTRM